MANPEKSSETRIPSDEERIPLWYGYRRGLFVYVVNAGGPEEARKLVRRFIGLPEDVPNIEGEGFGLPTYEQCEELDVRYGKERRAIQVIPGTLDAVPDLSSPEIK